MLVSLNELDRLAPIWELFSQIGSDDLEILKRPGCEFGFGGSVLAQQILEDMDELNFAFFSTLDHPNLPAQDLPFLPAQDLPFPAGGIQFVFAIPECLFTEMPLEFFCFVIHGFTW